MCELGAKALGRWEPRCVSIGKGSGKRGMGKQLWTRWRLQKLFIGYLGTTTVYLECENEDVEVTSSHASRVPIETRIEWRGGDVTWLCKQKQIKRKGKYIILIKVSSEKNRHGLERWLSSQNACYASIRNWVQICSIHVLSQVRQRQEDPQGSLTS